jgi:hypothetical protein
MEVRGSNFRFIPTKWMFAAPTSVSSRHKGTYATRASPRRCSSQTKEHRSLPEGLKNGEPVIERIEAEANSP